MIAWTKEHQKQLDELIAQKKLYEHSIYEKLRNLAGDMGYHGMDGDDLIDSLVDHKDNIIKVLSSL